MVEIKRGIILIVSLLFVVLITTLTNAAIWVTDGVAQQKNFFSCNESIGLIGDKLTPSTSLDYEIKNKPSGGNVVASGTVNTDANGDILFKIIWRIPEFYSNNTQHKVYVYDEQTKTKTFYANCSCEDNDQDGFYAYNPENCLTGRDCDNTTADIYPGAPEVCNGLDDNCDGGVDEGGDLLCDDRLYCNGAEYCDGLSRCQGTPINCSDDYTCTDDLCIEDGNNTGHCDNIPNNANCGEGEICDPSQFDTSTGCGPCTPNWIPINTSCSVDDILVEWYNDTKRCFEETNLSFYNNPPQNKTYYCDYDNNGVIGNISKVNTTSENISISIGNSTNLSKTFIGTETVEFKEGNKSLVVFDFNFSQDKLNLANLTINTQSENATKGSLLISGLRLAKDKTKIIYIDDLDPEVDKVCIKDAEIATIDEISVGCNKENEFLITCKGVVSDGYNCTDLGGEYKVTGLNHSGVVEYTPYCGDGNCDADESCSSCAQDCGECPTLTAPAETGGGGGGGGGGTAVGEWVCEEFSPCKYGKKIMKCYQPNNMNIYFTKTEDCEITKEPTLVPKEEEEKKEEERETLQEGEKQKFPEELEERITTGNFLTGFLTRVTGAIVAGLERIDEFIEIDLIITIVLLGLFVYYFHKRGKYKVFK